MQPLDLACLFLRCYTMAELPSPQVNLPKLPEDILKLVQVRLPARAYIIRSKLVSKEWSASSVEDAHLVGRLEGASQDCIQT